MLPFVFYFVTALITGLHVYGLLAVVAYGGPLNPLELVSLLGSLGLLVAAYLSLFKPIAAAKVALLACLLMWCFYAPALSNLIRAKLQKRNSLSSSLSIVINFQSSPRPHSKTR
jgi:hypothetical protein